MEEIKDIEIDEDARIHWNKIVGITETLRLQVDDLQEQLREFNKNPLFPNLPI